MNVLGLNQGTSGNVSVRIPGGLLITPSSLAYELMCPEDLVAIDLHGQPLAEAVVSDRVPRRPSSEWRLHADIFATRPDVQAVLHCHSIHATAIACHGRAIPPFHYMTAVAGGDDIRCAAYATFGTEELSRLAVQALQDRLACLLAQHGQVALGAHGGLQQALRIAVEVETRRGCICRPCSSVNRPCSARRRCRRCTISSAAFTTARFRPQIPLPAEAG